MGSGTTGVAALKLPGRTFIGIEISPRFVKRAWAKILQTEPNTEQEKKKDSAKPRRLGSLTSACSLR